MDYTGNLGEKIVFLLSLRICTPRFFNLSNSWCRWCARWFKNLSNNNNLVITPVLQMLIFILMAATKIDSFFLPWNKNFSHILFLVSLCSNFSPQKMILVAYDGISKQTFCSLSCIPSGWLPFSEYFSSCLHSQCWSWDLAFISAPDTNFTLYLAPLMARAWDSELTVYNKSSNDTDGISRTDVGALPTLVHWLEKGKSWERHRR